MTASPVPLATATAVRQIVTAEAKAVVQTVSVRLIAPPGSRFAGDSTEPVVLLDTSAAA